MMMCEGDDCPSCVGDECLQCENGTFDEGETDIDCGGICGGCDVDQTCLEDSDCSSGACSDFDGLCLNESCANGVMDGEETDVDCGGSVCGACDVGGACVEGPDCRFGQCSVRGECMPENCGNGEIDGDESDLDCGGTSCNPCFAGASCTTGDDCFSLMCAGDVCLEPLCNDGLENGLEEGVDCGGPDCQPCECTNGSLDESIGESDVDCGGPCPRCAAGDACSDGMDCESDVCRDEVCVSMECFDFERNGDETDVDCGGSCPPCAGDLRCVVNEDCESLTCDLGLCTPPLCTDGLRNGDEEGVDCGGSCPFGCTCFDGAMGETETAEDCGGECPTCDDGEACLVSSDCTSGSCADERCRPSSCTNGMDDGGESDLDCGGPCPGCATGESCGDGDDCRSGVCAGGSCEAPRCDDGVLNGFEGDVDCGGDCDRCPEAATCVVDADCATLSCVDGSCAAPSCDDGAQNGDEEGVDCGGSCADECAGPPGCTTDGECASGLCVGECVVGPSARFFLWRSGGAGTRVFAESGAIAGDAPIEEVSFDFGSGFGGDASFVYATPGLYTVTMRVRDERGAVDEASLDVRIRDFDVRLDRATATETINLDVDDLTMALDEQFAVGGVRSEDAIAPGSGVFYFEAEWLVSEGGDWGVGVGSDEHIVGDFLGGDLQSLGVYSNGAVYAGGSFVAGGRDEGYVGVVVDYRGANPVVHVIKHTDDPITSVTLDEVTGPLSVIAGGARSVVGPLLRLNTGADRRLWPFHFDVVSLLSGAAIPAPGLQLGFGGDHRGPANAAPSLTGAATASTPMGTPVELSVMATDAEDGDLGHSVRWENLSETFNDREVLLGDTVTFDPPSLGRHVLRARVHDSEGQVSEHFVEVTVTGSLERFDSVEMVVDETTGDGIIVGTDGRHVRFTAFQKSAIRGNQGILDGFHYFEATRVGEITAQGVGIVTPFGDLDPYTQAQVPWSCSAQVLGGVWRNFIRQGSWNTGRTDIGVAVDYRGDFPIVYFIMGDEVAFEIAMTEISVPVHPMVYGQPPSFSGWQWELNFGESDFGNDARAALMDHGVDVSGFVESWGR